MPVTNSAHFLNRKTAWAALLIISLTGLVMVLTPVWLVQPFRPQTERGLEVSYFMRRWSPLVTLVASAVALVLLVWLWRGTRRW